MTWAREGSVFDEVVEAVPTWLSPVVELARSVRADELTRFVPPHDEGRHSAVLMLFGGDVQGTQQDLLLIERAHSMRSHAGQPAFPGGAVDDTDASAVAAALREATEETGLDVAGVDVFGTLPDLWVPVTNFVVTPVLAWWRNPSQVYAAAPEEVASVHRVPISEFVDPAHRCRVLHPSGFIGPGFRVRGLLVWGFTAGLIDGLLTRTGWAVPWDDTVVVELEGV